MIQNLIIFQRICWIVFFFLATSCQLGANLVPKTYPKWGQVGSQEVSSKQTGKISKICTAPRRELDFQWIRGPNLAPKFIKNLFKNRSETDRPLGWVLDGSWGGFWTIFGASWEPRWEPKRGKMRSQSRSEKSTKNFSEKKVMQATQAGGVP